MAWQSSGKTNAELIANMVRHRLIVSDAVADAMRKVDRAKYVLHKAVAYEDTPQSIGYDATISAPHMHAHALSLLEPYLHEGARVLDVGSGSGYLTAALHHLVGPTGTVFAIEHIPELVEWSVANLRADGLGGALDSGAITVIARDGRLGYSSKAPYDAIHVGAAAPRMPYALVDQLACPGRMIIPVGTHTQTFTQVDKDKDGKVTTKDLFGVMYVPLTDQPTAK
ncbi:protein-L-isoaspartate O-methyltransferase [Auriscalpium vulgare]|uniref:Protein-L-isoaspartate O-methyltransferase n=1 Tax=Auriscalpium vulgare TaxID=40419 RepID=A0ACB8S611_9AGAM|nr:protein-L-isoaspartate O-methyltransferase [Auriscalpium vulgare]